MGDSAEEYQPCPREPNARRGQLGGGLWLLALLHGDPSKKMEVNQKQRQGLYPLGSLWEPFR